MKERQKKRSIFSWNFFWIAFVFGIIVLGVEYVGLTGYEVMITERHRMYRKRAFLL